MAGRAAPAPASSAPPSAAPASTAPASTAAASAAPAGPESARPAGGYGPWIPSLEPGERIARFRSLASLAALLLGGGHPLVAAFRDAERDLVAAQRSHDILAALPALTRRRLLATYAELHRPRRAAAKSGRTQQSTQ